MTHKMLILVLQLGLIILATRLSGWFFSRKLKQSQVLGELAAGMLIGPYLLGAVHIPALEGPLFAITEGTIRSPLNSTGWLRWDRSSCCSSQGWRQI